LLVAGNINIPALSCYTIVDISYEQPGLSGANQNTLRLGAPYQTMFLV
jgi:hypothetical protein